MMRAHNFTAPLLILMLALSLPAVALAQQRSGRTDGNPPQRAPQQEQAAAEQREAGPGVLRLLPGDSITEHRIDLPGGTTLVYTAAGTRALYDQSGEQTAAVFYTAYVAKNVGDAPRPLTFGFNGGPGAASAYLHLGLVGPKMLQFGDRNDAATAQLRVNPQTWLEFTDLVMIDPVGSGGWSRAVKPDGHEAFRGVQQDADVFAKVIALYIAKNEAQRLTEISVGRELRRLPAAKVARALLQDQGVAVSGIVMVSPMLEGAFQFGGDRFALGAAFSLPALAAAELEAHASHEPGSAGGSRALRHDRVSRHACRSAPQGASRAHLLCQGGADDRHSGRRGGAIARLPARPLFEESALCRWHGGKPLRWRIRDGRSLPRTPR